MGFVSSTLRCCLRATTLILFACLASYANSFEHFNPARGWSSIEGKHAVVNYPKNLSETAKHALSSAEHILPQLSEYLEWTPESKLQLVLSDQHDFANGYATPIPYNRSVLFVTLPSGVNELQDYDNWLDILILHELTHIIHLDKSRDWAYFPRYIFGRNLFTFPNLFQPTFLKEGLATYVETSWEKGVGRGQAAYYDMIMRSEVASGLLPLSKVQQRTRDWPLNKDYSYGVYFYQFLDDTFGEEGILKYVHTTSGQLIPFVVDRPVRHATSRRGLEALWSEYQDWLRKRFKPEIDVRSKALSPYTPISNTGYMNASPYLSTNGELYYIAFDPYGPAYITKVDKKGDTHAIVRAPLSTNIIYADDSQLLYLQPAPCQHNTSSFSLFRYDLVEQERTQVQDCTHYVDAGRFDNKLAAVKIVGDSKQLVSFDLETKEERILFTPGQGSNLASPIWLDQHTLLAAVKYDAKPWAIKRISLNEIENRYRTEHVLSEANTNFFSLTKGPNTDTFIVSSDKNGSIELWEFTLSSRALKPLTTSLGGATNGHFDRSNNTLVYRSYTQQGWDIVRAPYTPQSHDAPPRSVSALSKPGQGLNFIKNTNASSTKAATTHTSNTKAYKAIDTLAPSSWFFGFTADNAQSTATLQTSGRDALNFHNWAVVAGRDFDNELNLFQGAYTAYNHLTFLYSRDHDYTIGDTSAPANFVDQARAYETDETLGVLAHTKFNIGLAPFTIVAGFNQDERDYHDLVTPQNGYNLRVKTAGIAVQHQSAHTALYGISPSHGRSIQLNIEHDEVNLSPDNFSSTESKGQVWTIDWTEYLQIYQAHTLVVRAMTGEAERGADFFDLSDSPDFSAFKQALIHRREYPLRGYPDSSAELRGYKPLITSADYRFPIAYIDEGLSAWPVGLHSISGALFYEQGKSDSHKEQYRSAGLELNIGLDLGYSALPVALRAGIAVPFDETQAAPDKDTNVYFGFGYSL